ncbi:CDGSH iron-sulfur domain-containing protein [Desulfosporosinus sp. Sb-LF]|uniref:CDGSH iron-sulfur domain-containing protein n=1 Tax=Desulfosporosinus sp. Sb-LF TaxID=2560027 RepID=UPI00107F4204|nr:CDGSH iron-sulfur domain-containing protein [Desulfosporosinus sp. Sb-LF]TGE34620.1 iron-binding protein [Desulfosporosinus sp. Sb-LF]
MLKDKKLRILKNGPYIISGDIPLSEKIIVSKGKENEYKDGRELPQAQGYALCRCGKSKNPPFCDGSHEKAGFDGTEDASTAMYSDRAEKIEGPNLDLMDDNRCAFARFCHRKEGNVWELTEGSDNPNYREEAIKAASDCPAGRLVAMDKNGEAIEPEYDPSIEILQDPEKGASGPIFVKGNIPIESSDGSTYEVRNRVTLCRCGESRNKPYCDATHVSIKYLDHT